MKMVSAVGAVAFLVLPLIASASFSRDLQYGSTGSDVTELQEFLTVQGNYSGPITGNFYSLTRQAVVKFQQANNLSPAAGYFGPKSRAKVNAMLSEQDTASNEQAVQETGSVSIPTKEDALTVFQKKLDALLAQIQQLTAQSQAQTTIQQQTQTTLQQTQQSIQQVQQNTTPAPTPPPPAPPQVEKVLVVSADKTAVELNNWNYVKVTAVYTENGKPVPVEVSITTPEKTETYKVIKDWPDCHGIPLFVTRVGASGGGCTTDGKISVSYLPKTLGTHVIAVTANGITKTVDVSVIPYVRVDPAVTGTDLNAIIPVGYTGSVGVGRFSFNEGDESILINKIGATANGNPTNIFYQPGGGTITNFGNNGSATSTFQNYISPQTFLVTIGGLGAPTQPGNYTFTITGIEAYGSLSGMLRTIQGLPITFHYSVQ